MNVRTRPTIAALFGLLAAGMLFTATPAQALQEYYIDEITDYTNSNPCDIYDLNEITASLKTALDSDGWGGSRFLNDSAWPQDFWEECSSSYGSGGDDYVYGDSANLAIHAGHGGAHYLVFGSYHGSACGVSMTDNARMGAMAGSQAAFAMYLDCEVIQGSDLGTNEYQWLHQQAGWQNAIGIGDDEPRDFYNATGTATNADAWLNQMSSGGRDAIIATTETDSSGSSLDDCWSFHNAATLKGNIGNAPRGSGPACLGSQEAYWYCYEDYQN